MTKDKKWRNGPTLFYVRTLSSSQRDVKSQKQGRKKETELKASILKLSLSSCVNRWKTIADKSLILSYMK